MLPLAGVFLAGKSVDVALLVIFIVIERWDEVKNLISIVNPIIVTTITTITTSLFILLQVFRYIRNVQQPSSPCTEFPVKPMLFPCETAHVRMFPTTHGFKYSYLLVGIPVGWKGSVGGMISSDVEKEGKSWYSRWLSLQPGSAWYTVNGDDYLKRGHVEGGLQGKLEQYLESEGIDPKKYAYVYLFTAARFLGYASNPVSIWHLYSSTKELTALILEVNNTFDEKRIYFLEPSYDSVSKDNEQPTRYTGTWPKDFYVSVFNSRNGTYSLSASDPLSPSMTKAGPINTTITLNNSSAHAKLVARVYSTAEALDPSTMSLWAKTRFIASWWWVGLATFPRTVKEALTLLLTKDMPWVFRPEPRKETIARKADEMEQYIEGHFRRYLRDQIENCDGNLVLRYMPAGLADGDAEEEIMSSPSAQLSSGSIAMEIRVLTPIFYSRLVQYSSIAEALANESTLSATVSLSPDLLARFPFLSVSEFKDSQSDPDFRVSLLNILRHRPDPIPIPVKERSNIPAIPWSNQCAGKGGAASLNAFALSTANTEEKAIYFRGVLKLMLADRFAFCWMEILDLEIFALRAVVAWSLVKMLL